MKKIIIATDTWRPHMDGVVRHIEELLQQIEKRGFKVVVLHPRLFFSFSLPFYPDYRFTFLIKSKAKKIIEKENPDYIHIITSGPVGIAVRDVCLKHGLDFTTTYSTHFPNYVKLYVSKSNFAFNSVYSFLKRFHNAGNKTMVSTESLKEEVEKRGFKNVVVCPLGVNADFFKKNYSVPKYLAGIKRPVFVYLGRIAKEKNLEEFLKCDLPGTKLVIGDGPIKLSLEKKYPEALFVGEKRGEKLVSLLSASDVLVFPSVSETFGLTILEALACSVPVAAHNVMGPKDIITQGVDGFLDNDLTNAAKLCLKLSREKCREKALKFSWEKSADIFLSNLVKINYAKKV